MDGGLHKHVQIFMLLSIVDPLDTITYILIEEAQKKVEACLITEDQLKHIPALSQIDIKKKLLNEAKARDKQELKGMLQYSKLLATVQCGY